MRLLMYVPYVVFGILDLLVGMRPFQINLASDLMNLLLVLAGITLLSFSLLSLLAPRRAAGWLLFARSALLVNFVSLAAYLAWELGIHGFGGIGLMLAGLFLAINYALVRVLHEDLRASAGTSTG